MSESTSLELTTYVTVKYGKPQLMWNHPLDKNAKQIYINK